MSTGASSRTAAKKLMVDWTQNDDEASHSYSCTSHLNSKTKQSVDKDDQQLESYNGLHRTHMSLYTHSHTIYNLIAEDLKATQFFAICMLHTKTWTKSRGGRGEEGGRRSSEGGRQMTRKLLWRETIRNRTKSLKRNHSLNQIV